MSEPMHPDPFERMVDALPPKDANMVRMFGAINALIAVVLEVTQYAARLQIIIAMLMTCVFAQMGFMLWLILGEHLK